MNISKVTIKIGNNRPIKIKNDNNLKKNIFYVLWRNQFETHIAEMYFEYCLQFGEHMTLKEYAKELYTFQPSIFDDIVILN